jgi:8-oxo-dGTP pyrophosphatase MutT (NUDIX family)
MFFTDFVKHLPKIEKEMLLSRDAHLKMAPLERISYMDETHYLDKNPKKAAVLMLFYPRNEITHLALIVRNSYPGVHSSQIGFPGGKVELSDANLAETALRETHEEVGIAPHQIQLLKAFSEIYIPPSNFLVAPFMGVAHEELIFIPDPKEVKNEQSLTKVTMSTSYATAIEVPAFQVDQYIVWGATAMMMSELKEVITNALSR